MIAVTAISARIVKPPGCDGATPDLAKADTTAAPEVSESNFSPRKRMRRCQVVRYRRFPFAGTVQRARGQAADTITPRRRKPTLRETPAVGVRPEPDHLHAVPLEQPPRVVAEARVERRQLARRGLVRSQLVDHASPCSAPIEAHTLTYARLSAGRLCYQKMSSARMSRGETLVLVMQPAQDRPTHDLALAPGR